jgi:hypothetical protein
MQDVRKLKPTTKERRSLLKASTREALETDPQQVIRGSGSGSGAKSHVSGTLAFRLLIMNIY